MGNFHTSGWGKMENSHIAIAIIHTISKNVDVWYSVDELIRLNSLVYCLVLDFGPTRGNNKTENRGTIFYKLGNALMKDGLESAEYDVYH